MKRLARCYLALLYILPAVLFCSYYPIIRLGSSASMNFELSLPLIWIVLFDIIALLALIQHRRARLGGISDKKFFLLSLLPFYATISIFWSANPIRAILTAGIIWLLFFAVFAILFITPLLHPAKSFRTTLLKALFISSIVICIICWLQSILDLFGVAREHTLLCLGCVSITFGFPHPSGLAIEPQFMGNLLLAPTLVALYFLIFRASTHRKTLIFLAFFFASTLFLTFSRGAIYAFAVALTVLLIFALLQHKFHALLLTIPILAFIFTLSVQGIFNTIGSVHGSFCSGVSKSLNQLSLGIIDLRSACPLTPAQSSMVDQLMNEQPIPSEIAAEIVTQPTFNGYVAESTDVRLGLNSVAFRTWSSTPSRLLFGVGLGAAGTAMHAAFPGTIVTPKEIVQNQPISLLLELGLCGITLVIFSLLIAFFPQIFPRKFLDGRSAHLKPAPTFWQHPALPLLLSLLIAYLVTLQFFSGLPNALHIYLLPPLLYFVLGSKENYCNTELVEV